MDTTVFTARLGRAGGTTDADLRLCTRFVFGRPGWAVQEGADARGDSHLRLWVRGGPEREEPHWRIDRHGGGLVVSDRGGGRSPEPVATIREALVLIWEAGQGRGAAA